MLPFRFCLLWKMSRRKCFCWWRQDFWMLGLGESESRSRRTSLVFHSFLYVRRFLAEQLVHHIWCTGLCFLHSAYCASGNSSMECLFCWKMMRFIANLRIFREITTYQFRHISLSSSIVAIRWGNFIHEKAMLFLQQRLVFNWSAFKFLHRKSARRRNGEKTKKGGTRHPEQKQHVGPVPGFKLLTREASPCLLF